MPSHLRIQTDASTFEATFDSHTSPLSSPPHKKQRMSVTQTYRLAHTARGKLSTEASRGEYDLRVLVGHANLLDNLMIELAEAEKEQEDFYNNNIRSTSVYTSTPEDLEIPDGSDSEDDSDNDVDAHSSYSDFKDEQFARMAVPMKRSTSRSSLVAVAEDFAEETQDEDRKKYDDQDYDNPELSLVRTHSHLDIAHEQHVPELVHDSDDSDDESSSPPPSPDYPSVNIKDFAVASRKSTSTTAEEALHETAYWSPEQQPQMVAAC